MKTLSFLITGWIVLFSGYAAMCMNANDHPAGVQDPSFAEATLQVRCSPELEVLVNHWTNEYARLHPASLFSVTPFSNPPVTTGDEISFAVADQSGDILQRPVWKLVVGKDAVVPVINARNPRINEILLQGYHPDQIGQLITGSETEARGAGSALVSSWLVDNEVVTAMVAGFANVSPAAIKAHKVASSAELISAIEKDIYAIGFLKMADIRDPMTNEIRQGIKILPIDRNRNGRIDSFENIYDNLESFTRGVWIGKYPKALCGNIYALSSSKPTDEKSLEFLSWIISGGQQFLALNGYSDLVSSEKQAGMEALLLPGAGSEQPGKSEPVRPWTITLIVLALAGLVVAVLYYFMRNRKPVIPDADLPVRPAFNQNIVNAPRGLYYDKTHTWAIMEAEGQVKVGIDDFLQHITGTLSRIKMKKEGEKVRKGDKFLTLIREGKQLNLYSPVSGVITKHNHKLLKDVSVLHSSPYVDGWIYLIEPANWEKEIRFLFMGEKYREWLKAEFNRLKEFFTLSVNANTPSYAHVVLQDGGEIADHVLANLEPEIWEDFQTNFIDKSK